MWDVYRQVSSHTNKNTKVIILLISIEIYSQYSLPQDLSSFICPACRCRYFKYHSKYTKYHYNETIVIYVLKCQGCKKHHALIPSFSLPGTSLGTKEVEQYIIDRNNGHSRREAGAALTENGVSFKHLSYIERLMRVCLLRFEVLLPQRVNTRYLLPGFIKYFNFLCLKNRINAVFCNRVNILRFWKRRPGRIYSNDMGSSGLPPDALDSS